MAVADRTYTDPTAGIMQVIASLGGSKTKTSQSTSVDPAALANLQQILGTQMAGTTPEGAAGLLQAIFQGGLEQVPGLATTYAQASGARSSNNSPLKLAMQDMMLKLTQEGQKQLSANQVNAANTARTVAEATKSTNTQETKSPKLSAMQLAPFLLGGAGKLKGMLPSFDQASNAFDNFFGSTVNPAVSSIGMGGGLGIDVGTSGLGGSFDLSPAFDFGSDALASLAPDAVSSLADFGAADAFGFDFGSSAAADIGSSFFDTMGTEDLVGGFLGFEKGGLVGRDGMVKKKKKGYKPTTKPKGYASGGYITADRTDNLRDKNQQMIRGSTQNDDVTDVVARMVAGSGDGILRMPARAIPQAKRSPLETKMSENAGSSGIDEGLAFGEVGSSITPQGVGALATIASMALGVPGIVGITAANMMGFPAVSPMSTLINAITNGISGIGLSGSVNDNSINGPPGAGMALAADTLSDDTNAISADVAAAMDAAGISGGGGPGSSTGGADGVGDAAAAGIGGGGFAEGGKITGKKGTDVIPIRATAGEYVIQKEVVDALGVQFFDVINSMFDEAPNGR
jgi:hypothetical protein